MRIRMNKRILGVIHAILTYKRVISKKAGTEWFSETEDYFLKMSLPDTLPKTRRCLEKILSYEYHDKLSKLDKMNSAELQCEFL